MQKVTFPARGDFNKTLKSRVDAYFAERRVARTGDWRMFLKTALVLTWMASAYVLLVFFSTSFIMALITAFALAQGFVLVGFNVMHDGNHGSYSRYKFINKLMGFAADVIGGSSILWRQKHNILHHTYTNIHELDADIDSGGLLRLSPEQPWRPWHRFQHLYAVPLYSLLSLSWVAYSDFQHFFTGRYGSYRLRKPTPGQVAFFMLVKVLYFGYMIVLPLFFQPVLHVLAAFLVVHLVMGVTLSITFQMAHAMEGNAFPKPDPETGNMDNEWAIHQVETTADFAPKNKLLCWYLGGLNFQIEHHLFPKVCHIHYPTLTKIVEKTCREFSVEYISHSTLFSALAVHFRFLRNLGRRPESVAESRNAA